jgi:hypothetical protein
VYYRVIPCSDKLIRHRAAALRDTADALIDTELDWDFERRLQVGLRYSLQLDTIVNLAFGKEEYCGLVLKGK